MSDLRDHSVLQPSMTQLPVKVYFDPAIYDAEMRVFFDHAPGYVGHQAMVPNKGDYATLEWQNHAKMIVNNTQGFELMSNICRHRQAIMLKGRGNSPNIVCPIHRWTYDTQGELIGAPHFPANPCLNLGKSVLQNWHGMLFNGQRDVAADLAKLGVAEHLNFDGYVLDRVMTDEYHCNWKTFIEVYLEDYHVDPFHPGLGQFVNCGDLKWEFGDWYSVQTVGIKDALRKPGSAIYQQWHEQVLRYNQGKVPPFGAIWLTYFPNIMVEWYPNSLIVSHIIPKGPEDCLNVVEFYYPEEIVHFERDFIAAEQAAYVETADEDKDIIYRMEEGRRALHAQGRSEVGPYQSPTEDGMQHFHEFYRRQMTGHVALD